MTHHWEQIDEQSVRTIRRPKRPLVEHEQNRVRGATLVEFAMVIPLVLFLIMIFLDFSSYYYYRGLVSSGVHRGASLGSVIPDLEDVDLTQPLDQSQEVLQDIIDRALEVPGSGMVVDLGRFSGEGPFSSADSPHHAWINDIDITLPDVPEGQSLEQVLATEPMTVTMTGYRKSYLMGIQKFEAKAVFFRELSRSVNTPPQFDCLGNRITGPDHQYPAYCPCPGGDDPKMVWNDELGQCVCINTVDDSVEGLTVDGSCVCEVAVKHFNPETKRCECSPCEPNLGDQVQSQDENTCECSCINNWEWSDSENTCSCPSPYTALPNSSCACATTQEECWELGQQFDPDSCGCVECPNPDRYWVDPSSDNNSCTCRNEICSGELVPLEDQGCLCGCTNPNETPNLATSTCECDPQSVECAGGVGEENFFIDDQCQCQPCEGTETSDPSGDRSSCGCGLEPEDFGSNGYVVDYDDVCRGGNCDSNRYYYECTSEGCGYTSGGWGVNPEWGPGRSDEENACICSPDSCNGALYVYGNFCYCADCSYYGPNFEPNEEGDSCVCPDDVNWNNGNGGSACQGSEYFDRSYCACRGCSGYKTVNGSRTGCSCEVNATDPGVCTGDNQYFNPSTCSCYTCPNHSVANSSNTGCTCVGVDPGDVCGPNQTLNSNCQCQNCPSNAPNVDPDTGECVCNAPFNPVGACPGTSGGRDRYWNPSSCACGVCPPTRPNRRPDGLGCQCDGDGSSCAANEYWDAPNCRCVPCGGNYVPGDTGCECGLDATEDCQAPGQFFNQAECMCDFCPSNQPDSNASNTGCECGRNPNDCPAGQYLNSSVCECRSCSGNYVPNGSQTGCVCPLNAGSSCQSSSQFFDATSCQCRNCPSNRPASNASNRGCYCPLTASSCSGNQYFDSASCTCKSCSGNFVPNGSGTGCECGLTPNSCDLDEKLNPSTCQCEPCPSGKQRSNPNAMECECLPQSCPHGSYFWDTNTCSCSCPVGWSDLGTHCDDPNCTYASGCEWDDPSGEWRPPDRDE